MTKFKLSIEDICCHMGKIFFLEKKGGLFSYDKYEDRIFFLGQINGNEEKTYKKIYILNEHTLLFIPYEYGNILKYCIEEEIFQVFYEPTFSDSINYMPWKEMFQCRNQIYCLGLDPNIGILNIDLLTLKVKVENGWKKPFCNEQQRDHSLYFNWNGCQVGDCFWVPLNKKNIIMEYDMMTRTSVYYKVGEEEIQYDNICYDGKCFWLTGDMPVVIRWDKNTNRIKSYQEFPEGFEKRNFKNEAWNEWNSFFMNVIKWKNRIYFSPLRANMIIALDLESEKFIKIKLIGNNMFFSPLYKLGDECLYYQEQGLHSQCVSEYKITYDCKVEEGIFHGQKIYSGKNSFNNTRKYLESYPSMLEDFINSNMSAEKPICKENDNLQKWRNFIRDC